MNNVLKSAVAVLLLTIILVFPFLFAEKNSSVVFNQHYVESIHKEVGVASLQERTSSFYSLYTLALQRLSLPKEKPNYSNVTEVFSYVFEHLPSYAIVYPSEHYYYFSIPEDSISGNFRFVDIENGSLGMGYFSTRDQNLFLHQFFNKEDGLFLEQKQDTVIVSYQGKTVKFKLYKDESDVKVLENEVYVAPIIDESGVFLHLLFNNFTDSFYYILNEEKLTEELLPKGEFLIGKRTDFIFYQDESYQRTVLVGVNATQVRANTYFDGPFDQVPPYLNLREMIHAAYPYTKITKIDEFGNFITTEDTRMAISPYIDYETPDILTARREFCGESSEGHILWSCLAYDEKRDFHSESNAFYQNGTIKN